MSKILALSEKQIKVWFQNRRTKQRKEAEKDQFTTRSAESIMTTPPYALNTHQLNNTTQSSMWVIPNATSVSNIYFNNVPPNYFTTLNYKNIGHSQQEREQNYYQPAIESVAPAQQMQSSYNVLQNDMSSPYNQYGSYQTDSGTISCSQLQQETYNYQQPWYNYPNAQNNVQFFNESSHIDNNDYAYNNVAQNNYTYNNSVINESFNEKISFS